MSRHGEILLAENDPRDVELTLSALAANGLADNVITVPDGAEALDYLFCRGRFSNRDSTNPHVILLDLKMPKVDGFDVLRQVKSNDKLSSIPVVILTSSREDQDIRESYRLRANAYVVKPVRFSEFVDAVKEIGAFWGKLNESMQ